MRRGRFCKSGTVQKLKRFAAGGRRRAGLFLFYKPDRRIRATQVRGFCLLLGLFENPARLLGAAKKLKV
jgi:hypothetical protein